MFNLAEEAESAAQCECQNGTMSHVHAHHQKDTPTFLFFHQEEKKAKQRLILT
jgi:hypothetical protein